jgi:hypothetical protein
MHHLARRAFAQLGDQIGLHALQFGRGLVADQRDAAALMDQIVKRAGQRIQPAGEHQDLLGLEAGFVVKAQELAVGGRVGMLGEREIKKVVREKIEPA